MEKALIIDVREAVSPRRTGKGEWTHGLVTELVNRNIPLTLLSHDVLPKEWLAPHVHSVQFPERGIRWHVSVLRWLRQQGECMYLSPTSFIVPAFSPFRVRVSIVVHDLIAFHDSKHERKARWIERLTLPRALKKAFRIYGTSFATHADLLARFPGTDQKKIVTVFAGPAGGSPAPWVSDSRTILNIATLCPRKNQLRLIKAYEALPSNIKAGYELVLAGGRGWDDAEILEAIKRTSGVSWLGYVTAEHYAELLSSCAVFAYPSLYEGFGLPVLDAFRRGVPVLTSDRGSLGEIAADAALVTNPEDITALRDALLRIITDEKLRAELSAKGQQRAANFSWARTADLFLAGLVVA